MDLIKIGEYIAAKRKALGLTQKQLAEKLNMSDKSVSKWERGICLPDVIVYLELCKILGISINEFLAGEDIIEENIEQKSEENILKITKDNKTKQKILKKIITLLLCVLIVFMTVSFFIFKETNKSQNYIESFLEESPEMKTVELLSKHQGDIMLFHYDTNKQFNLISMYLTEYQKGKKISHKEVCEFYINPSQGTDKGNIALTLDQEASSMKIVVAYDGGYYDTNQISFSENIKDFNVWSTEKIEEKTSIQYGKKQMLVALFYGKDGVSTTPIKEIEKNGIDLKNDYMGILSFKFE